MGYLCANFSIPRPLCSRVRPDVCDRQTDVRQKHRLMPPPYGGGGIKMNATKNSEAALPYQCKPHVLVLILHCETLGLCWMEIFVLTGWRICWYNSQRLSILWYVFQISPVSKFIEVLFEKYSIHSSTYQRLPAPLQQLQDCCWSWWPAVKYFHCCALKHDFKNNLSTALPHNVAVLLCPIIAISTPH